MDKLTFFGNQINSRHVERAIEVLQEGGIIIYPTDTLYALGCDALNNRAIERLCRIKGINPEKHLLSIVCADISQASDYAKIDNTSFKILKEHLPGPFTFILPSSTNLPKVFKGRKSVGIRIPACELACELARQLGHPILSTSVEIHDDVEAALPDSIAMHYDDDADLILDAGDGGVMPSTIIDLTVPQAPEIIRQGAGNSPLFQNF